MLSAARVVGGLVVLKAVDVVAYGAVLPGVALGLVGLLLTARPGRVAWSLVCAGAVLVAAWTTVELTWQHTVLLAFLALGAAVSATPAERLVLWRVQLSVLYGFAAVAKLNATFLGGDVLAVSLRDGPLPMVLPVPALLVLAVLTVLVEAFLAVAPWVARLRVAGLVVACLLHAGAVVALSVDPNVGLRLLFFGGLAVALHAAGAGRLATADR